MIPRRWRLSIRPQIVSILRTRITGILLLASIGSASTLLLNAQTRPPAAAARPEPSKPTVKFVPDDVQDSPWLPRLKNEQIKAMSGVTAFHDFQFSDRVAQSGITFKHQIVDDAGKAYKAAHYDHGTGIAVADVDGDGLLDIYFVSQVGGNQLWKNLGGGKFQNITESAGVGVPGKVSVSASFADIDNDGDPDLYVTTVRGGNMLFENDGHGRFKDISAPAGLGLRRSFISAPFSLTTTKTAGWTCSSSTSASTRRHDRRGRLQVLRGLRGRVFRPPQAGARRAKHPLSQRGQATISRMCHRARALWTCHGPATRAWLTSMTTAGRTCSC